MIFSRGEPMTQIPEWVYHSSIRQGLSVIEPRVGTHAQAWVYAARDLVIASIFLGQHHDFILASGLTGDMPYICERFAGAFDRAKANVVASIYVPPGSSFQANCTGWEGDLISEIAVVPLSETVIAVAETQLLELRDIGQLEFYFYPDRPEHLPNDDSDLITAALEFCAQAQRYLDWLEIEVGNDLPHVIKAVREARA
jgi:hypothetical protein